MTDARELRCPSCGGPVGAGERLCAHCQAELATVRCPGCFSLELAGGKHCAQCGGTPGLEGIEGPLDLSCPRCDGAQLLGVLVGEHHVGECLRCTGLFVAHEVLDRVTRRHEERAGVRLRPLPAAEAKPETRAYLRCPKCSVHMNRRNFGERSGVIVDVCATHGVWFDKDELARALEYVDSGGLSRLTERDRVAASIRRLHDARRTELESLGSYDMVGSFLISLLRK